MNDAPDDMNEIEHLTRDALHARADQVEPSPDAYARLAARVTGASHAPAPWWRSPRLLWLGAAGAVAALLAVAMIAVLSGDDDGDQVATPAETATPVPTDTVAATPEPAATSTPEPIPGASMVIWPFTAPGPDWFVTPSEAVTSFYSDVLGQEQFSTEDLRIDEPGRVSLLLRGPDGVLTDNVIAEVRLAESAGRWGIVSITSPDVSVDDPGPDEAVVVDDDLVVTGVAEDLTGQLSALVLRSDSTAKATLTASFVPGEPTAYRAEVFEIELDLYTGPALLVVQAYPFVDQTNPSVHLQSLRAMAPDAGTPTRTPVDGASNRGRPEGVVWPVEAIQPFGEWPSTPEDAAQQFVQQLGGWTLPVGNVTIIDPVLMMADVELQFTDESGEPFGTSTTVRVLGGFDEAGVANWGAAWALSDFIEIDRTFFDGDEFLVSGAGQAFEGVIETRLVDPSGNVAGEGFVMGGGVEMASMEGSVTLTENLPGPGFALLYDLGGLGITPTSLTIVAIELPEIDQPDPITGNCSGEGLEPPAPDPDLPEVVEATRQAIATAAIACDWAALDLLIDEGNFSYSFGDFEDPIGFWEELEGDSLGEPMRFLVQTLKMPWVADPTGESIDGDEPSDWYIWPDAFPMLWEDVTEAQREALRSLYNDQDFEGFANIGGFAGYRLALDEAGNWRYFIAGD